MASSFVVGGTTAAFVDDAPSFRGTQNGPLLELEVPLYVASGSAWSDLLGLRSWAVTVVPIPGGIIPGTVTVFVNVCGGAGPGTLTLTDFPGSPLQAVLMRLDRESAFPAGGRRGTASFLVVT